MKILVAHRHYPISMASYFKHALRELGHELWTIGTFDPSIPWNRNRDYRNYVDVPDFEVVDQSFPTDAAIAMCPFKPDLVLAIDSVFSLSGHNSFGIPQAIVLTDPHCLKQHYRGHVADYDHVFCMQHTYVGDYADLVPPDRLHWLPYAYDPRFHFPTSIPISERPFDVGILSALLYDNRLKGLAAMEAAGLKIKQDSGILFDDASRWYGDCKIAFNWSSEQDLPARVWEGWAMGNLVLTNRVPDLEQLSGFYEGEHYLAYSTIEECVQKAQWALTNYSQAACIAWAGNEEVVMGKHTWTDRVKTMLQICGVN